MPTAAQVIVLATPVFLAAIGFEWWWGRRRGHDTYRADDALASIGAGVVSQLVAVLTRVFGIGIYIWVFERFAPVQWPADRVWVWACALLGYDFLYYWHHRFGHRVALGWAAHAVHHQSEEYNLSTALRQTSTGWLVGWLFYLPMALAGVPPVVFATVALIDLLYQFWVHTRQIGSLGAFDRWFCSPSNHRVHHAINERFLDKNYGGILMLWDHLFGTFEPEDPAEPCVYGTRAPLRSWSPLAANLQIYRLLWADSRRARRWRDKLRVWLEPPGWRPADVAAADPQPPFELSRFERWAPAARPRALVAAGLLFALAFNATAWLLWQAHELSTAALAGGALAVVAALVLVGRWMAGPSAVPDTRSALTRAAAQPLSPELDR